MKKQSSNEIKSALDRWVSGVGTGRYQPSDYVDDLDNSFSITENFGIQQVKSEIYKFIDILLKQEKLKNCLEIGLGFYGSTHFLWRLIFEKTTTIEHQRNRVFNFRENMNKFHKKFVFNDLKSRFIFGLSHDTSSVEKIEKGHYFVGGVQKSKIVSPTLGRSKKKGERHAAWECDFRDFEHP